MNINFHYFAVKTIALESGFDENAANRIAAYSQFVDDYDIWVNYIFESVPKYAESLIIKSPNIFYTVTTGFTSMFDTGRLGLHKYQREIVVPFHFIPIKKLKDFGPSPSTSEYRTAPATINGTFLIKTLLDNAKKKYIDKEPPKGIEAKTKAEAEAEADKYNLMRIGLLLHIFADTYAHQNFSGFHGWENFSYIKKVKDNFEKDKDITGSYKPDIYEKLPSIGHANVNTAPDDTFVTWGMTMAENSKQTDKTKYSLNYSRSNTQVFCDASKEILNFLLLCQKKDCIGENKWEDIKTKLVKGFSCHAKDEKSLAKHWNSVTRYGYHYDKDELWKNILFKGTSPITEEEKKYLIKKEYMPEDKDSLQNDNLEKEYGVFEKKYKTAKDDFFYYNLLAKETRDAIIE